MRRSPMWVGVLLPALASMISGCPDEDATCPPLVIQSDTECVVAGDCAEDGFPFLSCIDGKCRVPCTTDTDCRLQPEDEVREDNSSPRECLISPDAICEAQVCVLACHADADCSAGDKCLRLPSAKESDPGRCGLYFESFETVDVFSLGWVPVGFEDLGRLPNPRIKTAWSGVRNCDPSNGGDLCAGPPASGERFAIVEASPTPPKGTPETAPTCGACACCLECVVDPPLATDAVPQACSLRCEQARVGMPTAYCGVASPAPFDECPLTNPGCVGQPVCPATVPARCSSVCTACDSCMTRSNVPGNGLAMCEAKAAGKTCGACTACDACGATQCPVCATDPSGADCTRCQREMCFETDDCKDCYACADLAACQVTSPNSAECAAHRTRCEAQGNNGCYQTPIDYPRSQLTDEEQSLVSRKLIEAVGITGALVLEFTYVPFNVGNSYFQGVQGQAPPLWPSAPQQLLVQLCAGACDQPGSWSTAKLVDGRDAIFPPANQRGNGLSVGRQSPLDWRSGKVRVAIPETHRTPELRVRFLPKLGESVRIGIDDVILRRGG